MKSGATTRWLLLSLLCGVTWSALATHQTPVSTISVINTQSLAFGRFAAGSGGAVVVSTSGGRIAQGGVVLLSASSGAAARFNVSGDPNFTYALTLPANGSVVLSNEHGSTMTLNDFTSTLSDGLGQLNGAGQQSISVGARLDVSPNQSPGAYSGTFSITVDYD